MGVYMKSDKKLLFILFLLIMVLSFVSCEELFTTIKGKVTNDGIPVSGAIVLVLNANENAYEKLQEIDELNSSALSSLSGVVKGFDIESDENGDYIASMLSGGTVYLVAINDEDESGELDSLDLIGWYGDIENIKIPNPYGESDSITVVYTDPNEIIIENNADTTGINVSHMIQYWLLLEIQEYIK
jgi:hypothetical protein